MDKLKHIKEPLKERLKKNSITNILHFILTFPLMFIITPMILKYVGKELYGVWALTGTILIFVELFGGIQTSSALSILVPRYNPETQNKDINELVNTMFVFYLFSAMVFLILYLLTQSSILKLFFNVKKEIIPLTKFIISFSLYLSLIHI